MQITISRPRKMPYKGINATYQPLLMNNENNNFYWVFGTLASEESLAGGDGSRPGIIQIDIINTPRLHRK